MRHQTEKNAAYTPHPTHSKTVTIKRQPELKLEGAIECQPEYRKAYVDYLIREKVDRKPRPIDNLLTNPTKRAFDVLGLDKAIEQTEDKGQILMKPAGNEARIENL